MSTYLTLSLIGLPIMIIGDLIWFSILAKDFYVTRLGDLLGNLVWQPAVVFYVLYALGIAFFVTQPQLQASFTKIALHGAFFGLIAYGTFDLTSQALIRNWPLSVTIVDMAWGTLLTATASVLAVYFYRSFIA